MLGHCAGIMDNSGQETVSLSFHPQGNLIRGKMDHLGQGCFRTGPLLSSQAGPGHIQPFQSTSLSFSFLFPPPTSFFEMQIQIQNPSFSVNNSRTAPQQSANLPGWLLAAPIQVEPTMELQILSFSRSSRFSHHPTLSTGNLERIPALLPGQQQAMPMGSNSHCGLNSFLCAK